MSGKDKACVREGIKEGEQKRETRRGNRERKM